MINCMKFWLKESDIDGFRCDVAGEVPDDFWKKCIAELKKGKNIFMLAEGNKATLQQDGFDATYCWDEFAMMKKLQRVNARLFCPRQCCEPSGYNLSK